MTDWTHESRQKSLSPDSWYSLSHLSLILVLLACWQDFVHGER